MSGATYQHTAHKLGSGKVAYPHHPYYGYEVRIIRRQRKDEAPSLVVEAEDGVRFAIPSWMLDEICCDGMVIQSQALIGLEALIRLRELLDLCRNKNGQGSA